MKKLLVICTMLAVSAIMYSQNGSKNFIDQNYIEITGTLETEITPDEIYLSITINEKDKKGNVSVEQQENEMIAKFKQLGLDLKNDFKIQDYSSNYQFYFLKKTTILKSKKYQLIVHSGLMLGKVYQALESIEISNVIVEKVRHSKIEKLQREAKLEALKIAKQKASDYAEAIDQTIGKALFIQEVNTYPRSNYSNVLNEVVVSGYGSSKSKMENINDIAFEKIKIYAAVLCRFELK